MPKTKEQLMFELKMSPNEFEAHVAARSLQFKDEYSDEEEARLKSLIRSPRPKKQGSIAPTQSPQGKTGSSQIANLAPTREVQVQRSIQAGKKLADEKWITIARSYAERDTELAGAFTALIERPFDELHDDLELDVDGDEEVSGEDFFAHLFNNNSESTEANSEPQLNGLENVA